MIAHFLDEHSGGVAIASILLGVLPQWLVDTQGLVGFLSVSIGLTIGIITLKEKLRDKDKK